MTHLFCFGFGYSAQALVRRLPKSWQVTGTSRSPDGMLGLKAAGIAAVHFDGAAPLPDEAFEGVTHLLVSVPPDARGDPVLQQCGPQLNRLASQFSWVGYLSTTGVYGDLAGGWVDESAPLKADTERGSRRIAAEAGWAQLGLPLQIFRLAGIYGPGRNQLVSVLNGTAKRIVKPGQVFSRIHVEDIAGALLASMERPEPGEAYNVCDDEPCPPQDVVSYAAQLLNIAPPPEVAFEEATLSPMARSFYADSKRVSNRKIKQRLGCRLLYPSYREGLQALAADLVRGRGTG